MYATTQSGRVPYGPCGGTDGRCRQIRDSPPLIVSVFVGLLVPLLADAANFTKGKEVAPFPEELKPGDYVWHPEISPAGPVVLVISLPDQQLYVFRNGVRIGRSTVSTGKKGHRPRRASSPSSNGRSTTSRASTKARRCRTCSG